MIHINIHLKACYDLYKNLKPGDFEHLTYKMAQVAHIWTSVVWTFCSESSRNCQSQTVRPGEMNFWENVHPPPCVTFHVSHVMCYMSHVRWQVSHFSSFFFFLTKLLLASRVEGLLSTGPTPFFNESDPRTQLVVEITFCMYVCPIARNCQLRTNGRRSSLLSLVQKFQRFLHT